MEESGFLQERKNRIRNLPCLLFQQSCTGNGRRYMRQFVGLHRSRHSVQLLSHEVQVASPHHKSVSSLDMTAADGRFLLTGGADAIVSVFDISKWGTGGDDDGGGSLVRYKPVAQSVKTARPLNHSSEGDSLRLPPGHSHSVLEVQWYPVDSGVFLSASVDGTILVWDTNSFCPASRISVSESCRSMALPRNSNSAHMLLATGSMDESVVRLCDITSATATHQLAGHTQGAVTAIEWSPSNDYQLCTGGEDGVIRLWDIRKSGNRACLSVLDREHTNSTFRVGAGEGKRLQKGKQRILAPNNYSQIESPTFVSHGGAISALTFTPHGDYLVSTGRDGQLRLWDLAKSCASLKSQGRKGSHPLCVPTSFLGPSATPDSVSRNMRRVPLIVTQHTMFSTATAWIGNGKGDLMCFPLQSGGTPTKVLPGHLSVVTSMTQQHSDMRLFTGGKDGMILAWGCPRTENRANIPFQQRDRKRIRADRDSGLFRGEFNSNHQSNGDADCW